MDTLLGVLAHSALAFGLVAVSFLPGVRIDLMAYLFGDILAVGRADLGVIWGGAALVLALLAWRWSALLTATLNPDLACASGIDPRREQLVLTLALAVVVAVAIKVVGALLIAAHADHPRRRRAALRAHARGDGGPRRLVGGPGRAGGARRVLALDTPTGPTIVAVAAHPVRRFEPRARPDFPGADGCWLSGSTARWLRV